MKKSILIIHRTLNGGGAEKNLLTILKNIDRNRFNIELFLIIKEGVYIPQIEKLVTIKYLFVGEHSQEYKAKSKLYNPIKNQLYKWIEHFPKLFSMYINRFILDKKYDKVISFLEGYPMLLTSFRKEPKISWVQIDLTKIRIVSKKKELRALKQMDQVICVSKDAKRSLLSLYPSMEKKVQVLYNPIDINLVTQQATAYTVDRPENKLLFVSVGRLGYQKGFDYLIEALGRLKQAGVTNFKAIIVGEGPERSILEQLIKDWNVKMEVALVGFHLNPFPYMHAADAIIIPSRFEGFCLVAAEGLALKKTIISTETNGPVELLENGKYGILTPEISANSLYKTILSYMHQPVTFDYHQATEKFNIKHIIKKIEQIFEG